MRLLLLVSLSLLISCNNTIPPKEAHFMMCELSCLDNTKHTESFRKQFCAFKEGKCLWQKNCQDGDNIHESLKDAISVGLNHHCFFFKKKL